jgi:EmrB/QacA subfamily drug resistance transporter
MTAAARRLALGVIASATLMTILDGSIVTVAMPAIQADLGFSATGLSWVINAYLVAFGSLLLLFGRLGDLVGRTRVFIAGTAVFTAASVLAGAATTGPVLIAARFAQGIGSAMAVAVSLGILVTLFTEPAERARAIAVFAFTGAAGATIGQVLGGVLTDAFGWHWIFLINLPIGLAVIVLALRVLPREAGIGLRGGADWAGAVLVTAGLVAGILAVLGETSTVLAGIAAVVLLAGFAVRQVTAPVPLVPPRLVRSRAVAGANLVQILMIAACFSFQVLLTQYLQRVAGYGAAGTGLAMLPAALVIGVVSLGVSARLVARFGERPVLASGLALLTLLFVSLARLPTHAGYLVDLLPVMLLTAGFGLALPALTALGMSGARADDAGLLSGVFNTTQQIGMALGVAMLSTVAATRTDRLATGGASEAAALTGGYRLAFAVGAGLMLAAFTVALVVLRRPARNAPGVWPVQRAKARKNEDGVSNPGRNAISPIDRSDRLR